MSQHSVNNAWQRAQGLSKLRPRIRMTGAASRIVCTLFLTSGIVSIILSIYIGSNVMALIGLGLTFWGALFIFISPKRRVDGSFLYNTVLASYSTMDRIITGFKYEGRAHYIPTYPRDFYLPEHLKSLKDPIVFISAKDKFDFPSIEGIAESKFLVKNPKGMLVTPPGLGLLDQVERKLRLDFAKTDINELTEMLPLAFLEKLDLAEDLEMTIEGTQVKLQIIDSIYKDLYSAENKSRSVSILGCPIASTVACILAKATGNPVTIQTYDKSPDGSIIQIQYNIEQGLGK